MLDYWKPIQNYKIVRTEARSVNGEVEVKKAGEVKAVVANLSEAEKNKLIRALKRKYKNAQVEDKGNRLLVKIGWSMAEKKKNSKGLMDQIKNFGKATPKPNFIDMWGGIDQTPKPKRLRAVKVKKPMNIGLLQKEEKVKRAKQVKSMSPLFKNIRDMFQKAENKYQRVKDIRSTEQVGDMFQKYQKMQQRMNANKQVQGVGRMFQEAQNEIGALEWKKQLEQKQRLDHILNILKPLVAQIKKKEHNLKKIGLAGVEDKQKARFQNILQQQKQRIKNDKAAQQWGKQLDQKKRLKQKTGDKCAQWKSGNRKHNPFNDTKRGRPMDPKGPTARMIDEYCVAPSLFCEKPRSNTLWKKIC